MHLLKDGGEQFSASYDALNPSHLVRLLEDDGMLLAQSLAIIEHFRRDRAGEFDDAHGGHRRVIA